MDKQNVLCPHNEILFDKEKELSAETHHNVIKFENVLIEISQIQKAQIV